MKGARLDKFRSLVKGLEDLLTEVDANVSKAAPAAEVTAVSEDKVNELVNAAVTKVRGEMKTDHDSIVKGLQDRITKLEAAPVAPAGEGSNATEEPDAVVNKNQGTKSLWAGVL